MHGYWTDAKLMVYRKRGQGTSEYTMIVALVVALSLIAYGRGGTLEVVLSGLLEKIVSVFS